MTKFISQVFCFGPESTDELDGFPYRSKEQIFFDFPNTYIPFLAEFLQNQFTHIQGHCHYIFASEIPCAKNDNFCNS